MSPNLFEQRDDDMDVDVEGDGMEVDVEADTGGGSTVVAELGGSTAIPAKDKALPHITLTTEDAPENRFHDPRQASSPNITEHSPWTLAGSDPSFVPVVAPFTHTLYLTATSPTEPGDGWRMVSSDRLGNPAFNDANPSMRDSEHPTPSSPNGGVNTLAVETHFSRSNSTRGLKSASSKKRGRSLSPESSFKSLPFSLPSQSGQITPPISPFTSQGNSPFTSSASTPCSSSTNYPASSLDLTSGWKRPRLS